MSNETSYTPHKGRSIIPEKAVHVYRNLNNGLLSIRQSGEIKAHSSIVYLENVTFHVQPAGHQKTISTGVKCVHAYAKGTLTQTIPENMKVIEVKYNPFYMDKFQTVSGEPIQKANYLSINQNGEMFAYFPQE